MNTAPEDKPNWLEMLEWHERRLKGDRDGLMAHYQGIGRDRLKIGKDGTAGHAADLLKKLEDDLGEVVDTVSDLISEFSDEVERLDRDG